MKKCGIPDVKVFSFWGFAPQTQDPWALTKGRGLGSEGYIPEPRWGTVSIPPKYPPRFPT